MSNFTVSPIEVDEDSLTAEQGWTAFCQAAMPQVIGLAKRRGCLDLELLDNRSQEGSPVKRWQV